MGKGDGSRSVGRKLLRRLGIAIVAVLGISIAALAIVMALGITFSLDAFRADIEAAARGALGRAVEIEGPLTLVPAFRPTVEVQGLRIANPPGWDTAEFLRIDRARVILDLLPLLDREISIDEIVIEGVDVGLETRADGQVNWAFEPSPRKASTTANAGPGFEFVRLGELALRSLTISIHDATSNETYEFEIEEIAGSAEREGPIILSARGLARGQPFRVAATGGSWAEVSDPTRAWPLEVSAELAGAVLTARGRLAEPLRARGVDLDIAISGNELEAIGSLIDLPLDFLLPPVGPYDVSAHLGRSETAFQISELQGSLGNTKFGGNIVLARRAGRPRVSATLDVATLDLGPFLAHQPQPSKEPPPSVDTTPEGKEPIAPASPALDEIALSLEPLQSFDADVTLNISRVIGIRTDVLGASLRALVEDGQLAAPMSVTVSDVPVEGKLTLQAVDGVPRYALAMSSPGSRIDDLAKAIKGTQDLRGGFEDFRLRASGQGRNARAALESLDVLVAMGRADLSYGHEGTDEPVHFTLETLEVVLAQGHAVRVATRGTLLDEAFSFDLTSATVAEALTNAPWPIDLTATGAGARLSLKGTIPEPGDLEGTTLDLEFGGNRIGDLAAWVGATPNAGAAYAVSGKFSLKEDKAYLESIRANLGHTTLDGNVAASWRDRDLLLKTTTRFKSIDPAELVALFAQQGKPDNQGHRRGLNLYMPILPYGISIVDADLDLTADRIHLQPVHVTNATFIGRIRDGRLKKSPFTARLGEVAFNGQISLDLRGELPVATFDFASEHVDVGRLLSDLQIVEVSETKARRFEAQLILRGNTLRTVLEKSEATVVLEDAVTIFRDPNTQAPLEIGIAKSTLSSIPGRPITYDVDGRIENTPVEITIETDPLASFTESRDHVPLRLRASTAGSHLEMKTSIKMPFSVRNLDFYLALEGGRLDSLDEILHVSLPPWGPYTLDGNLRMDRAGYHASALNVRAGDSRLKGRVSLDTTGTRPRLAVNLRSKTLQLNDFRTGEWSALEYDGSGDDSDDGAGRASMLQRKKAMVKPFFTAQSMRAFNARVSLEVDEVLSGRDRLGNGRLVATLEDGLFSLDPILVDIPEGSVDGRISFELTEGEIAAQTRVNIEHLDYGVLARRIDPGADADGWLSLDLAMKSHSSSLNSMLDGASGHFDFAVWPRNIQGDIFDLWAANLVLAVLPRIDSGSGSKVNCVVGVLDITDGIMIPKKLLIDTTNVQVAGDGEVNFKTRQVDLVLVPKAKRPTMFTLATPLRVRGNQADFRMGATPDDMIRSVARFATSVLAPVRRIFDTTTATDGEAACLAAMERTVQ